MANSVAVLLVAVGTIIADFLQSNTRGCRAPRLAKVRWADTSISHTQTSGQKGSVSQNERGPSQILVEQYCDIYSTPTNSLGNTCVIILPSISGHCSFFSALSSPFLTYTLADAKTHMCVTNILQVCLCR